MLSGPHIGISGRTQVYKNGVTVAEAGGGFDIALYSSLSAQACLLSG